MKQLVFLMAVLAGLTGLAAEKIPARMIEVTNAIPNLSTNKGLDAVLTDVSAKWPIKIDITKDYAESNWLSRYATTAQVASVSGQVVSATGALWSTTAAALSGKMGGTNLNDATFDGTNWNINWNGKTGVWQVIDYAVYTNATAIAKYTGALSNIENIGSNWVLSAGGTGGYLSLSNGGSRLWVPSNTVVAMFLAGTGFLNWTGDISIVCQVSRGGGGGAMTAFRIDQDSATDNVKAWPTANGVLYYRPTKTDRSFTTKALLNVLPVNTTLKVGIRWQQWQVMLFRLNSVDPDE